MDFEAALLYLIHSGIGIRADSQLEVTEYVFESIEELLQQNSQEIKSFFAASCDKVIDRLGEVFAGAKGIKSLDQSKRYGLSPIKPSRQDHMTSIKDKENMTKEQLKEEHLKQGRKKQCLRKFKQVVDMFGHWKSKAAEFDGMFRSFDGIRRNFEQLNQYLAKSTDSFDLQKWMILPLVNSRDEHAQLSLAKLIEFRAPQLQANFRQIAQQQNRLASYFQHIVPVSADELGELKERMKTLDSNYNSYQSAYDHLKPVFDYHLDYSVLDQADLVKKESGSKIS